MRFTGLSVLPVIFLLLIVWNGCTFKDRDIDFAPRKHKMQETKKEMEKEWIKVGENGIIETGIASWYGNEYHGKRTANGEIYDMDKLTAAHKTLPFNTLVEVENLENNEKVTVRINDRGPFVDNRIIDLSRKAAKRIDIYDTGTAQVCLRLVKYPENVGIITDTKKEKTEVSPVEPQKMIPPPVVEPSNNDKGKEKEKIEPVINPEIKDIQNGVQKKYYLQAGAFGSQKNAERMLRELKIKCPNVVSFRVELIDGLYKLISEDINSMENARENFHKLKEAGISSIIKEGNR